MENNGHGEITIIIVGMQKFTINSDLINRSHAHQIPCSHDVWEGYTQEQLRPQTLHLSCACTQIHDIVHV